jgi:thioredoxin reductase
MKGPARIAIIGAGPIGLEAAVFARLSGYEVAVYERGSLAQNVRNWGHVRLFSPFGLNASPWGRECIEGLGLTLPGNAELLTGREFAERYLQPLSELPEFRDSLHFQTEVRSIGRGTLLKADHISATARGQTRFRLLLSGPSGEELAEADFVLDCSGTYPHHNWAGAGGIPCPGERDFLTAESYQLPDILGADRERFANRLTLVVGGAYSAATAIVSLAELAKSAANTKAIWLTRKPSELPIQAIAGDSLPERERLTTAANRLARDADSPIAWRPGSVVRSIFRAADQRLEVTLEDWQGGKEKILVDEFLAQVGYHPDRGLYEELQVHECYATQGPIKLAAALLGETSADCLAQSSHGGETLKNPEPGFYILGANSYGRGSRFLLKIGIEQIREVFSLIANQQSVPAT